MDYEYLYMQACAALTKKSEECDMLKGAIAETTQVIEELLKMRSNHEA